jgi:tyrosine-protein phosphatase OCA6
MKQDYPPFRFAMVESNLYRGAYPKPRNVLFLKKLKLKQILSLTPEPLPSPLQDLFQSDKIACLHFKVDKPKESIPLSFPKVLQILQILTDPHQLPLFIHCLDGTLVTSLIIMSLRKLQGWNGLSYKAEACRFLREGVLSSEESEFMDKFTGELELPLLLPNWLHLPSKHPFFKFKVGLFLLVLSNLYTVII